MGADPLSHCVHDLHIGGKEVIAAHSGFAGNSGGHDHHVGTGDCRVVARPGEVGIEPLDRRCLRNVQCLALRDTLCDVEKNDVAQLLQAGQQHQCAADIACADQRDLVACHEELPGFSCAEMSPAVYDLCRSDTWIGRLEAGVWICTLMQATCLEMQPPETPG